MTVFQIWYFHHSHGFNTVDQGEPLDLHGLNRDLDRASLGPKEFVIYHGM